jgi:hypothetical protein
MNGGESMTRFSVAFALVLALASAGLATAGGGNEVVAIANGTSHFTLNDVFGLHTLEVTRFVFHARQEADGSAEGRWFYSDLEDGAPWTTFGDVTCVTIRGGHAWIGGTISYSSDPSVATGLDMWFQVIDNGGGEPDVTTLIGVGSAGQAKAYCDAANPARFPWTLGEGDGNIEVHP